MAGCCRFWRHVLLSTTTTLLLLLRHPHGSTAALSSPPTPITDPRKFPAGTHCSRCGLCETSYVVNVMDACAFLPHLGMQRLDELEYLVHGRSRKRLLDDDNDDEARFGVLYRPIQLAMGRPIVPKAQWTGVVTSIATAMLEAGKVDAVMCVAASDDDKDGSRSLVPRPILARTVADIYRARGVKPSLAPSLNVLDELQHADPPIRRLLFCGVGCAVQAFRTIEKDLQLEQVYVLGTNCADNSPTPKAAAQFLQYGVGIEESDLSTVAGYEFMQDYRVHVKLREEANVTRYVKRPYFSLPPAIAETAIAKSCLTCMDYTNGLADVVVGYMGAPLLSSSMDRSYQTLTVRNRRGAFMVDLAQTRLEIRPEQAGRSGRFVAGLVGATLTSDALVNQMVGSAPPPPNNGMPVWIGEILATILTQTGPKGLNFAKYSIDYHILRNYFYILHQSTSKQDVTVPSFSQSIIDHYLSTDPNLARLEALILARKEEMVK
jgi:coenzyme F420-reducing hydrogenase beta subunit